MTGDEIHEDSKVSALPLQSQTFLSSSSCLSSNNTTTNDNDRLKRRYSKTRKIGEGTFAVIYEANSLETGKKVAIKKIKMSTGSYGIDIGAIREIRSLQTIKHPNILNLIEVFPSKKNINLVLEYLECDLEQVIKNKSILFMPGDVKAWMLMLLRGVHECHSRWILHRDLKPNNLLISSEGELKIADFGLARCFGRPFEVMTSQVVTRWYRAPELLFGSKHYTPAVDIWAVGCIFAELMLRTPYLPGNTDMDQLTTIFRALGTPSEEQWPGMSSLPDFVRFPHYPRPSLKQLFTAADSVTLDLLESLLAYDPMKRPSALQALKHPYFSQSPVPTSCEKLANCIRNAGK